MSSLKIKSKCSRFLLTLVWSPSATQHQRGVGDIPVNSLGQRRAATTRELRGISSTTGQVVSIGAKITLDINYINNATDLSIARTLIHELVHAYLWHLRNSPTPAPGIGESMTDIINRAQATNASTADHDIMADSFVDAIAAGLANWDGHRAPPNVYQEMAWSGAMKESDAFARKSISFQTASGDRNIAEQGSSSSNTTAVFFIWSKNRQLICDT